MGKEVASQNKAPQNMLMSLKEAQTKYGYVPQDFMVELAESLDVPINDVYATASFYSFISTKPLGRNVIRICRSLPCYLEDCQDIIDAMKKEIGIMPGETTGDGRFSLELVNCIGLCDKPPAMLINSDAHVDLTTDKIAQILKSYE